MRIVPGRYLDLCEHRRVARAMGEMGVLQPGGATEIWTREEKGMLKARRKESGVIAAAERTTMTALPLVAG